MSQNNNEESFEISSKAQWVIFGLGFILMMALAIYSTTINDDVNSTVMSLETEATQLRNDLKLKRDAEQQVRNEVIYQTTGINPKTVQDDTLIVKEYLTPAFKWTDGEGYNKARAHYANLLGENNKFVEVYLAPNLEEDGHNYVDLHELKSDLINVELYALNSVDTSMDYLAVVEFFMYKDNSDLVGQGALQSSTALINLTVTGTDDARTVVSVDAKPGFNVSAEQ